MPRIRPLDSAANADVVLTDATRLSARRRSRTHIPIHRTGLEGEHLDAEDAAYDAVLVTFTLCSIPAVDRALAEAFRVLKTGGRFMCLEFSEVQVPILDRIYDFHSFEVIPRLGKLAAGAAEPYQYLVESIRKFPKQEAFATMIRDAGFERVTYRNLTGGVAAIHSGWKI